MINRIAYQNLRKVSLIKYGRLYNWPAAAHANIAPVGWSVPTDTNFTTLTTYINNIYNVAPNDFGVGNHLKHRRQVSSPLGGEFATSTHPRWESDATHYGRDSVLFGVFAYGYMKGDTGATTTLGSVGNVWATNVNQNGDPYYIQVIWNARTALVLVATTASINKKSGFAIRCFRPAATWEQALTDGTHRGQVQDIDGNIYDTVKIGTQVWFVQNLATTRLNDGTAITHVTSGAMSDSVANYANYNNNTVNVFFTSHSDSIWKPKDFVIP